jgi:hypothetical protein
MSTNDVPGAKKANKDVLAAECWAEADDGSLIIVRAVEAKRVVYEMYDLAPKGGPIEYRHTMDENGFKRAFSWTAGDDLDGVDDKVQQSNVPKVRWTWHDKTPVPWDRIFRDFPSGMRVPSAAQQHATAAAIDESLERTGGTALAESPIRTAARLIADVLNLRGNRVSKSGARTGKDVMKRLRRALDEELNEDEGTE